MLFVILIEMEEHDRVKVFFNLEYISLVFSIQVMLSVDVDVKCRGFLSNTDNKIILV